MQTSDILVVGGGIYGTTAALELRRRGHSVTLIDPGPLPHPLAASTDISKVVRMEYGQDRQYMQMVDKAIDGFVAWNNELGETLYHNTGVLMLTRRPMEQVPYNWESYRLLQAEGHSPERLDSAAIAQRFPAWNPERYVDGFYSLRGGYAESGRVVSALQAVARREGVSLHERQTGEKLLGTRGQVTGVRTREGTTFQAGHVLVAAGAWTQYLLPELQPVMKATGHPVFHLKPQNPTLFSPPNFAVFTADVSRTGWYGFPFHPREGVVKVASHGVGKVLHPEQDERVVYDSDIAHLRGFLAETFPALADAELVYTRRCLYCDTLDEHFWIDRHPERAGLSVSTGGSGHGFKFAPVLGGLAADVVEGKANPWAAKFAWRALDAGTSGEEASRFHGGK